MALRFLLKHVAYRSCRRSTGASVVSDRGENDWREDHQKLRRFLPVETARLGNAVGYRCVAAPEDIPENSASRPAAEHSAEAAEEPA